MSDTIRSEILSSMHRGSAKRQQQEAVEAGKKAAAVAKDRDAIETRIQQFLATQLPMMSFKAAEAGQDEVVVHKIDNDDLEHGYDSFNPMEEGRDSGYGLTGEALIVFDKLRDLGLQPECYHGGEIDFETYGEAYYIVIPVIDDVAN